MTKRYQIIITLLAMFVVSISGIHINDSNAMSLSAVHLSCESEDSVMMDAGSYNVNSEYSRINRQKYWNTNSFTHLSASFFRRSQTFHKGHERIEVSVVTLDTVFRVFFFSIVMILFATGGAGMSMPFRCLLCYIHGMDGKKKIA